MLKQSEPAILFLSYAYEDEYLCEQLVKHLSLLQRQGLVSTWHHRQIHPGTDWSEVTDAQLASASIILLLVSPDFLASDYCYGVEMQRALARQRNGTARVIPIILRPVDWHSAPFAHLLCLPPNGRPVTSWHNQDEAFHTIVQSIRTLIEFPANSGSPFPRPSGTNYAPFPRERRYRQHLLDRVYKIWIEGVLQSLLGGSPLIPLKLYEQPGALYNPLQDIMQESAQPARSLPSSTHVSSIYDQASGELLILGQPGSGKTVLLLELVRVLLERSHLDENYPLPIVLNLSEWSRRRKQQPFSDWIGEELHTKYKIHRSIGRTWIDQDQFLLLLDGLDEVSLNLRGPCLAAINAYQEQHSLTSIVVCCRQQEYAELTHHQHKLQLQTAITIQPLTHQQIDTYLQTTDASQQALKTALQTDTSLQQLAETPLMLSILARTYQTDSPQTTTQPASLEILQDHLFETYIRTVLQRRGRTNRYTEQQTRSYLAFLARQMNLDQQTEFYIEQMQPSCLDSCGAYPLYRILTNRCLELIGFFCIALFFALFIGNLNSLSLLPGETGNFMIDLFLRPLQEGILATSIMLVVIGIFAAFLVLVIIIGSGEFYIISLIPELIARWWGGLFDIVDEIELIEAVVWPWELFKLRTIPLILNFCLFLSLLLGILFGLFGGFTAGPNQLYMQQCDRLGGQFLLSIRPLQPI